MEADRDDDLAAKNDDGHDLERESIDLGRKTNEGGEVEYIFIVTIDFFYEMGFHKLQQVFGSLLLLRHLNSLHFNFYLA